MDLTDIGIILLSSLVVGYILFKVYQQLRFEYLTRKLQRKQKDR